MLMCSTVVFNLFYAVTHFATQSNDHLPKISSQAYEVQLCWHSRKPQLPKTNMRYHYVEQRLIY